MTWPDTANALVDVLNALRAIMWDTGLGSVLLFGIVATFVIGLWRWVQHIAD